MDQEVLVSIRGLQMDLQSDEDAIEIVTSGTYKKKNNKGFLLFDQYEEDQSLTKNVLTFDEKSMELTRRGGSQVHMSFFQNEKTLTNYGTPFGNILVGVDTRKIRIEETESQVHVAVDYALELNYEYLADCELTVDITPKAQART
ncbi:MAG: DUF1934 domain-containing protein [Lachnospiraceae bacterium]|nr:DUF1934 domain-containing protein [Lachnospiraceae bacterium]